MKKESKECGVSKSLKIIGSKWTMLIIRDLCEGMKRFGQLQHSLEGISPRTLSARLKQLENDGIITKKVFPEIPPHVEYRLTKKGQSLEKIIAGLRVWGDTTL